MYFGDKATQAKQRNRELFSTPQNSMVVFFIQKNKLEITITTDTTIY